MLRSVALKTCPGHLKRGQAQRQAIDLMRPPSWFSVDENVPEGNLWNVVFSTLSFQLFGIQWDRPMVSQARDLPEGCSIKLTCF